MQDKFCRRYVVTGLVQGVCYRSFVETEAKKLKLTGWVRNLPQGDVEVLACGSNEALDQLAILLNQGPRRAQVTQVQDEALPWEQHDDFIIQYMKD